MLPKEYQNKRVIWESRVSNLFSLAGCLLFVICAIIVWNKLTPLVRFSSMLLFGGGAAWTAYRLINRHNVFVRPNSRLARDVFAEEALRRQNDPGPFAYDSSGFTVFIMKGNQHFAWRELILLSAYREEKTDDRSAAEYLCLDLEFAFGSRLHITEQMAGWLPFTLKLGEHIPSLAGDWLTRMKHPAMNTRVTLFDADPPANSQVSHLADY